MGTLHAKLSASGSAKWIACPGSIKAEEGIKEKDSPYAQEGTMAHELGELALKNKCNPDMWLGEYLPESNESLVEQEMVDYIQQYVDYVRSFEGALMVEQQVDFSPWVSEGFGTSDAIIIDGDHLRCIDLKYGKGVRVDAEENTQGILYALGAINDFCSFFPIEKITISIVQPRLDHISEWTLTFDELMKWGERIKQAAELALTDDAPRTAGEKQCQWCKAKGNCPALMKLTETTLCSSFDNLDLVNPDRLTDDVITNVLSNKKLILAWLDAVEDTVVDRLKLGGEFEGYKLVSGKSNRAWGNEADAAEALIGVLKDELYTHKIISPTQAEKLLGKSNAHLLDGLVVKPEGAPTIAPMSDKRPAININASSFD